MAITANIIRNMFQEYKTITYKGKVVFHKITTKAPTRDLKPFQDNEACFMFVNRGEFSIRTPDQLLEFNQDEGLLAKCFNFFVETTEQQRSKHESMEFLGIFLFPEHVENLLDLDLSASSQRVDFNVKQLPINQLFKSYKDSVNVLVDNPELSDQLMIETKLKEFVLLISKSQNMTPLDFLSSMFNLNQTPFRKTIEHNLYGGLALVQFAQLSGMSLSTFKRKFKEEFKESPKKYISRKQLELAVKKLKSSRDRISSIAYDCGYETISTFNRSFKLAYGASPSAFRLTQNA
ncbi:MAG: AraC-like DNA-binding protein [Bacteroidia bacterium]